jgi:hypothetical protein
MAAESMSPPRQRSRYAPDRQVKRALTYALEHGVAIVLSADGSVAISGRLDAPAAPPAEEDIELEFENWKRQRDNTAARGQ